LDDLNSAIDNVGGAFGSHKKTNYYQVLDQMINDAVDRLNSEQVDQALAGALLTMKDRVSRIASPPA
jgi:hypothetical protein